MHHICKKCVQNLLTDDQKVTHVNISHDLLDHANADENFLKNIITEAETMVYSYNTETKTQSSQLMGKGLPRPKNAHMSQSNIKAMLVGFFTRKVLSIIKLFHVVKQ